MADREFCDSLFEALHLDMVLNLNLIGRSIPLLRYQEIYDILKRSKIELSYVLNHKPIRYKIEDEEFTILIPLIYMSGTVTFVQGNAKLNGLGFYWQWITNNVGTSLYDDFDNP